VLYALLKLAHVVGAVLIGGGLIGVWLSDLRSRQIRDLPRFSEAVRNIAVFYDGIVVPGAILLLVSGTWLILQFYNGWAFLSVPWLAGMVFLFAFEFIEGNTITRVYFMKLRRITGRALEAGHITPELEAARHAQVPTFTHFLDLPLFLVIVSSGVVRLVSWTLFFSGTVVSLLIAAVPFYSRAPDVRMGGLAGVSGPEWPRVDPG
jgi:uncharacterized membrane protein